MWFLNVILILSLSLQYLQAAEPGWSDEFNGDKLDTKKWQLGFPGGRHHAINAIDQISVYDGCLHIKTQTKNGKHYTAMLSTEGIFETAFGYWEIRAKVDDKPGTWSDAWLYSRTMCTMDEDINNAGMEVDIFEHRFIDALHQNINNLINYGIHWNGYGEKHKQISYTSQLKNSEFHTFGLRWTKEAFHYFVDGEEVDHLKPVTSKPLFLILSTEVRDNFWAGDIPSEGYNNETLVVDYVRYYREN